VVQTAGGVCILMYLSTHINFLKHLVKVITVLSKLNDVLKKLGCITTRIVVYVAAAARRVVQTGGGVCILMYLSTHINFFEASCEGYYSIIKIK